VLTGGSLPASSIFIIIDARESNGLISAASASTRERAHVEARCRTGSQQTSGAPACVGAFTPDT